MDDAKEKLALVDAEDNVIGEILRGEIGNLSQSGGRYIRAANAFIVRYDDKIWIPIRAMHKDLAPGGLDYSVGAHVQAGEDYIDSLVREFEEEAGLKVATEQCDQVAYNAPFSMKNKTIYFNKLFIVKTDDTPVLSDEHTDGSFLDIEEIIGKVRSGATTKAWFLEDLVTVRNYLKTNNRNI